MSTAELQVLTSEACRRLLNGQQVGRLGVVRGGYPVIVPVNYVVHGDRFVVRTNEGGKFFAARQSRVALQVDHIDHRRHGGWSVLVQGFAVEVTPADDRFEQLTRLPGRPWAPGDRNRLLLITPVTVTGRRLRASGGARGAEPPP